MSAGRDALESSALGREFVSLVPELTEFWPDVRPRFKISSPFLRKYPGSGSGFSRSGFAGTGLGHSGARGLDAQAHRSAIARLSPQARQLLLIAKGSLLVRFKLCLQGVDGGLISG